MKLQLRKESSVLLGGRTAREDESVRDQAAAAAVMKTGGGVEPPSAAAFNRCHLISEGSSRTLRDTASLLHADIIHFSSGSISPPEEHPAPACVCFGLKVAALKGWSIRRGKNRLCVIAGKSSPPCRDSSGLILPLTPASPASEKPRPQTGVGGAGGMRGTQAAHVTTRKTRKAGGRRRKQRKVSTERRRDKRSETITKQKSIKRFVCYLKCETVLKQAVNVGLHITSYEFKFLNISLILL